MLGISSFTYGWSIGFEGSQPANPLRTGDLVDRTLQFGLRCLQIGDNLPLHNLPEEELDALRLNVLECGIRLEVGARRLAADHLMRYIGLAESLRAPLIRFVIDDLSYEPGLDSVKSLITEYLPELRKRNITLGIENHDRFKARELAELMEGIGSRAVGICLDCANSLGAGEGLVEVAGTLAPYTVNLHIKDFTATRKWHKMGFEISGAEVGKGLVDISWLLETVAGYGRCESVILEQWVPPDDDPGTTISKEERWAAEGITFLKGLPWFKEQDDVAVNK